MSSTFAAEKAFLDRKLPTFKIAWEILPAVAQLISPPLAESEVKTIISQLRDAFVKKAGMDFPKMVFSVNSKLRGGLRIVVVTSLLREYFAAEIDGGGGGGGGKGLNPISTRPTPMRGGGV